MGSAVELEFMGEQNNFAAKPTIYNGVTYRSRLEASFAEWLTDNGADFTYEPGCFGNEQYLPDFELSCGWIEIKPICFHLHVWVAIRAAQQCKRSLMVIDSPNRGEFGCYAAVSNGQIQFFTSLLRMMTRVTFDKERHRPVYYVCGPFQDNVSVPRETVVPRPVVTVPTPINVEPVRCKGWDKFIEKVGERRPLIVLWLEPASSRIGWLVVTMDFPESQRIAAESLSRPNNKKLLEQLVEETFGTGWKLEFQMNGEPFVPRGI
jgi:hypothetical protein